MITHIKRDNPSVICVFFLFGIHLYYILLFLYGYYNYIEYCMTCCVRLTVKELVLIKVKKKKTVGFSFACSQPLLLGKLKVRSIYDKAQRLCASVA